MKYFLYCRKSSESEDRQVLSIDSQQSELQRVFGAQENIRIVEVLVESYSAKAPGRPIFDRMLSRIERGEADGIITWHPDRLARNSIDGGRIIHLLDRNILKDLKFSTFTFENNSQGKFMLSIMLGYSKYYVDSLSENVKRGNRAKIERGWRPNLAPLGYVNEKSTKTIIRDPVHFPLIRRIFELMLTGTYSPRHIAILARDQWGFQTPQRRRIGGKPMGMSTVYKILSNPFYTGVIVWGGQTYPGRHEAVVSIDEFERVQEILGKSNRRRPQRHDFPFTGLIRCGACGLMITAEHKVNRFGSRYIYYRCTNRRLGPRCAEPVVQTQDLTAQIFDFLQGLVLPRQIFKQLNELVDEMSGSWKATMHARKNSLEASIKSLTGQMSELTGLRLRNILTDDEFLEKREELKKGEMRLSQQLQSASTDVSTFEPLLDVIALRSNAGFWFENGTTQTKRQILSVTSSNLSLKSKILSIEAKKPFVVEGKKLEKSQLLTYVNDVRTWAYENPEHALALRQLVKALTDKPANDSEFKKAA